jgi:hypothetical protein
MLATLFENNSSTLGLPGQSIVHLVTLIKKHDGNGNFMSDAILLAVQRGGRNSDG